MEGGGWGPVRSEAREEGGGGGGCGCPSGLATGGPRRCQIGRRCERQRRQDGNTVRSSPTHPPTQPFVSGFILGVRAVLGRRSRHCGGVLGRRGMLLWLKVLGKGQERQGKVVRQPEPRHPPRVRTRPRSEAERSGRVRVSGAPPPTPSTPPPPLLRPAHGPAGRVPRAG